MRSILVLLAAISVMSARAYDFIGTYPIRWPNGNVEMVLQFDDTLEPILMRDGTQSWDAVARRALNAWNSVLNAIQITDTSGFGHGDGNERNEAFFSYSVYGHRFGNGVLAVTTTWHIGSERVEGDTIFNANLEWDSYRGPQRSDSFDFQRVAIHEFGHIVGLDHPDQAKQVVVSIMNSTLSDLDQLADDDVAGAQALYAAATRFAIDVAIEPPGSGVVLVKPTSPDHLFARGGLVTLTPKPKAGFRFNYWDAPEPNSSRVLKLRPFADQGVTAYFTSNSAPRITAAPKSQFADRGETVVLRVNAANASRASYQWQMDGIDLPGETTATLTLPAVDHSDSGLYSVIVTTTKGSTRSKPARLIVEGY